MSDLGTAIVTVGPLTLYGHGPTAPNRLTLDTIDGWFEPVDADDALISRAFGRGTRFRPNYLQHKPFTITGWVEASSLSELLNIKRQIASLRHMGLTEVKVTAAGETTSRLAMAVRTPTLTPTGDSLFYDFSIDFIAQDPRRYGPWQASGVLTGSSFAATNAGTADTPMQVELTRNTNRQTITTTAGTTVFDLPLASGAVVLLEPRDREIQLDGIPSGGVTSLHWPTIPKASVLPLSVTGVSSWKVWWRDAWW